MAVYGNHNTKSPSKRTKGKRPKAPAGLVVPPYDATHDPALNHNGHKSEWDNGLAEKMLVISLMTFHMYKELEAERAPYSIIEPYAIAIAALLGLDDPIATPKIAPARMQSPTPHDSALQSLKNLTATATAYDTVRSKAQKQPSAQDISDLADYDFGPQKMRVLKLATELTEALRFANEHLDNPDAQILPEPFSIARGPFASYLHCEGSNARMEISDPFQRRAIVKFLWQIERGPKAMKAPALRALNAPPFALSRILLVGESLTG